MTKYVSGRQKDLKVGISSYSETKKSLEVIGRVGVGTTSFDADAALDIRGDVIISGITTLNSSGGITTTGGDFYVGGDLYVSDDIVYDEVTGRNISISGVGTIAELGVTGLTTSQFIEVTGIGTAAEWAVSGLTTSQFLKITGVSTFTGNVSAASSIWVGGDDGLRLSFYTDTPSTSSYLENNTGNLYLQDVDGDIYIRAKRNQNSIYCTSDGSVDLYYSGVKKLETTNEGVLVSGGTTTSSLSVTGVSTLGTDSAVGGIKVGYGNTAFIVEGDGRVTGILTVNTLEVLSGGAWGPDGDLTVTSLVGTALSISGISTFSGTVGFGTTATFPDDASVYFGDGEDLRIYHDGTHSYISNQGTGDIKVLSDTFILRNSADSKVFLEAVNDAGVLLSYNDVKKLETTGAGITVTGLTSTTDLYVTGGTTVNNFNVTSVSTLGSNVIVGGATTDLLVNGDCRITGILTVGTDSITIDGNTDIMNVGSGITMYASAGIISAQTLYVNERNIVTEIDSIIAGTGVIVQEEGTNIKGGNARFEALNFVSDNLTASDSAGAGNTANITLTDTPVFDSLKINTSGISTFGGVIEAGAGVTVTGLTSTSQLYVTGVSTLGVVTDVTSIEATNFYGTLIGTASSATQWVTPRSIQLTGDVVATETYFDGTGNVSIAATIQANSVALSVDTVGDYVQTISPGVAADGIDVTNTSGEGVNATVQFGNKVVIPNEFGVIGVATVGSALTVFGDVTLGSNILKGSNDTTAITLSGANATIAGDLTVDGDIKGIGGKAISFDSLSNVAIATNLHVGGNITVGGTSAYIVVDEFRVTDKDIVVGYTTDSSNNVVSSDTTANGGGIAVASTIGNPLVDLTIAGVHTHPSTYKDFAWFKLGAFSGLNTDAWLSNYPIGIGSTQFPTGTRLVAGNVQVSEDDIGQVRNINASGIITAPTIGDASTTVFYGDISNTTGTVSPLFDTVAGGGSTTVSVGIGTTAVDSNASLNVVGTTTTTQLYVSGVSTFSSIAKFTNIVQSGSTGAGPMSGGETGSALWGGSGLVASGPTGAGGFVYRGFLTGGNSGDPTSSITADGVGIFSGIVQSGGDPNPASGTPSPGTKIADWGTVFACNAATSSVFASYTTGDSVPKILLYADGVGIFSGTVESRSNFKATGTTNTEIWTGYKTGDANFTSAIYGSGAATFHDDVTAKDSSNVNYYSQLGYKGRIILKGGEDSQFLTCNTITGDEVVAITDEGAASFAGNIGVNTDAGSFGNAAYKGVQVHSSSNAYFTLTNVATGHTASSHGFSLALSGSDASLIQREDADMIFHTNNTERLRIIGNGRVGIGTTLPLHRGLTIHEPSANGDYVHFTNTHSGTGGGDGVLIGMSDGSWYNGSLILQNGNTNAPIIFETSDGTRAERMRISETGNVGIGTTLPVGQTEVSGNDGFTISNATRTGTDGAQWRFIPHNGSGSATNLRIYEGVGATEVINITKTGNIGIGTTNPEQYLHIHSTVAGGAALELTEDTGSRYSGLLQMNGDDMEIRGSSGKMEFYTGNADGSSSTQKMCITDSGSVLIGHDTHIENNYWGPSAGDLQVVDDTLSIISAVTCNNAGVNASGLDLMKSRGTKASSTSVLDNDRLGEINFYGYNSSGGSGDKFQCAASIRSEVDGTPGNSANDMPGALLFGTTPEGVAQTEERMRITSTGNVGIATANPTGTNALLNNTAVLAVGVVTANTLYGDGSGITNLPTPATAGDKFNTGISSVIQLAPGSIDSILHTFGADMSKKYVIESISVANVVSTGTTVNIIASVGSTSPGSNVGAGTSINEKTYIAYNVPIPTGGLVELLKEPMVINANDTLNMWSTDMSYIGVPEATEVYVSYSEKDDTSYFGTYASNTSIGGTSMITIQESTSYPSVVQSIHLANRSNVGDYPISVSITNGTTTTYLAKNLIIPRYSAVEILERPKRIQTGGKIKVQVQQTSTVDVAISGKQITS